jgi:hypothetical protein
MIRRSIAMLMGGLGAAAASQAPEFAQQYAQRLGGALDELRTIVQAFDQDAAREGLAREAGLRLMETSNDSFVARRGRSFRETVQRYEHLSAQMAALQEPGALGRVAAIARGYDQQIAARALEAFRPAVPVTSEGFFFALAGFLGGTLLGAVAALPLGRRPERAKAYPARR